MHAQQHLPGFQHMHQHHAVHQTEHWQNVLSQRLQALQRETARLQQEMGNIEHRSRALATGLPDMFNNQQDRTSQPPQVPVAGIPLPMGFRPTAPIPSTFPPPPQLPQAFQHLLQQRENERASTDGRQTRSGRSSPNIHRPDHTTTYSREAIGPNGERWQMTVNETTSTFQIPQHPALRHPDHPQVPGVNPALDTLQAMARTTDRLLANQRAQPPQNIQSSTGAATNPLPSGATASPLPQAPESDRVPPTNASTGVPPVTYLPPRPRYNPVFSAPFAAHNIGPFVNSVNNPEPTVYILSSPQGPQALLLQNSDTYYTLPQTVRRHRTESPTPVAADQAQAEEGDPVVPHGLRDEPAQHLARRGNRHHHQIPPLEPVGAPHGNPGAGALGARIGPMVWLIIRLAGFVWFFTAGNNSWPRFVMITALAVLVFIINTGIFNGIAEALWGPVRRHVEALIPLAGPEAALVPAANAAAIPQQQVRGAPPADGLRPRRRRGELDEVEVAARLIRQQREGRADWWITQVRRAEHAALLFLASLVPGVGERHIAAREAAANAAEAERQRELEAAEATAAAENAPAENPEAGSEGPEGGNQDTEGNAPQNADGGEGPALAQPVIAEA